MFSVLHSRYSSFWLAGSCGGSDEIQSYECYFIFLNLTRTRLRKAEFCESYQNEQKSLQLQGRRLRLKISRSHWFRVKKQLVTYRINIWFPSNKTLLYCGYSTLKNSFDKQAKAGSLRGKYFRINRRTSRLRVSFNCNYKLKE